eukprot:CAMPEP_0201633034 /NCGR_PEP_ID=MMETSP0493-20130528/6468_1 /ASSEMBLY_ACC=CAM_ASM_000838 /TAXON_ID=420259 /ORGANISM="Thalassiosira gravida, Strain GMp14c1" /LENGTH=309 /DNA_ID=CAMNT_0048104671 /DNA_START=49 /DNA_END=978 /DNA_ORIENTATION=+
MTCPLLPRNDIIIMPPSTPVEPSRTKTMLVPTLLLLLLSISPVRGDRMYFGDTTEFHVIDGQDYESHNIFVVNGTTLTLENGSIIAPDSGDDGESAVRIEDANFVAIEGIISGGMGVGGTGVTISTTRDSDYPPGIATFEAGVEVYGGDATRDETTKGGDAVQVLQSGSKAIINGGKFVPGTGCTIKVCGTEDADGVALQVVQGEAIIKGGSIEGDIVNVKGDIELHGCVEYDEEAGKITGVLLDGSNIDVVYKGQGRRPSIISLPEVCGDETVAIARGSKNGGGSTFNHVALTSVSVVLGMIITLQSY